jgi:sugar phosphate isomerase/epimerase
MKFAVDTFSYYMHFGKHRYIPKDPVDIHWYCETSKKLGAGGLHIDPYHIDLRKDREWIRDFAAENNMYIELGACGTSMAELKPSIEAAHELGATLLRTFAGGDCFNGRESAAKKALEAKKQLSEVLTYAANKGVRIALENHGDLYIDDINLILELNSDFLGVCFDSGNFAFTGEDPLDGLAAFDGKIICTHLKDVCKAEEFPGAEPFATVRDPVHFCALGEGYLPIEKIIKEIVGMGIENITMEICSPCDKLLDEESLLKFEETNVVKSISYMRNIIDLG